MIGLTAKQVELLDFIRLYIDTRKVAPTIAEMAERFGFDDTRPIRDRLRSLELRGYIHREPRKPRSITLTESNTVRLLPEIHRLAATYAAQHGIALETAVNELMRGSLGAA